MEEKLAGSVTVLIENLYLSELHATHLGVRLCPKLTKNHIWLTHYTQMRMNLAAQVSTY